jgi:hypothetical protein
MNQAQLVAALNVANAAPFQPARTSGCGRAYVCVMGVGDNKKENKAYMKLVAAACKEVGLMFLDKNYGAGGNAIYMGYDNADGRALGRAAAFAKALNAAGVRCYEDAAQD